MPSGKTVHSIQLLRSVAATLVVLFHAQQSFAGRVSPAVFENEGYLFGFGAVGVHVFFVISGFIMVLTTCQPDRPYEAGKFFKRRLMRIYPIYWLSVLIYLGVHGLIGQPYRVSLGEGLRALLLWPSDAARLIGPAWTLTYEMFFYLCFGVAMLLGLTRGLVALFIVFAALMAIGYQIDDRSYDLYVVTSPLLAEFLAGAAIGWLAHTGRLPHRCGSILTAISIALFAAGLIFDYTQWERLLIWGIPSAVLVLGLVCWESDRGATPAVTRLGRLGDSSYVLYLIHILIITVAAYLCHSIPPAFTPSPPLAALLIALVGIAMAECIHRGIERPLLALLNPKRNLLPTRAREVHQP